MKSDTTTTALNYVLAALVIPGVFFAAMNILRIHDLRQLTSNAAIANANLMRVQGLANDVAAFNVTAKSPELTRILQSIQSPVPTK